MERQRALWRVITSSGFQPRHVIEVAPLNPGIFGGILKKRFPGCRYIGVDKWPHGHPNDPRDVSFVDLYCDICELDRHIPWKADTLILQHVLEEVPRYQDGLQAIRRSVLPDATAYVEIPVDPKEKRHVQHPPNRYGNVWLFSEEQIHTELRALFRRVSLIAYNEGGMQGRVFICGT